MRSTPQQLLMNMPYAISAGHDATAQAAATILDAGGNAVDAAIAALATSWIAEPCMSGAAGGGFANIRTARGKSYLLDFFVQTPLHKRPLEEVEFIPIEIQFSDTSETFYAGQGAIGVPGCVAGIFEMHRRFGTIPMQTLLEPAIHYAREGVVINDFQYEDFVLLQSIIRLDPRGRELFFEQDKIKTVGQAIAMPNMADMLDFLARSGQRAFYEGEIAQLIIQSQTRASNGGFLTRADFEQYEVHARQPLQFT
ncbi:MAG: gamma-glutamyltransferase, partial [Bacteroidota bacterium]